MKKIPFILSLLICMLSISYVTYAEDAPVLNTVEIVLDITESPGNAEFDAQLQLTDGNGTYLSTVHANPEDTTLTASFSVSAYAPGKKFKLSILSGLESIQYYDTVYTKGQTVEVQTYTSLIEGVPTPNNTFHLHAVPTNTKPVEFYRDFKPINIYPAPRYYDGVLYVPASEGARSMDISNIEYDINTGKITYWILTTPIYLQVGSKEVTAFGSTYYLEREVMTFDEIPFVPLLSFAEIVEANVIIQNEPDHVNAVVSGAEAVPRVFRNEAAIEYINSTNLTSDTEYLIWVSKADYKLRVFKGTTGNWSLIKDITCAIGKLSSPTCTGTFKYYERVKMWPYAKYYVGPIMRFNGGYAIHTTLLQYNGVPYDNRVGMNLSAGCVRLQPQDMYWLIDLIPMYTTVHITNF